MARNQGIEVVSKESGPTRNQRIKEALKSRGISQNSLADKLGISSAAVNERLNKSIEIDSVEFIGAVSELTGFEFEYLLNGVTTSLMTRVLDDSVRAMYTPNLTMSEPSNDYLKGSQIRPITVTVSPAGQELVTYVPVKAQAGYMKGYGDPHFIERLPAFTLPGVVKDATYRMFEVDGDSMLQLGNKGLRSGEIVIAKYVEDIFDMKDNRVYVVISTEGTAIKRVINRLKDKESPSLIMMSDNKNGQHPNYILKPKQIKEVWEAKRYISGDFSFDTNLYEILGDLQAEQAILKEKVKNLEHK